MFATRLNDILQWIDTECPGLKAEDMRDGFRTRIVELTRDFLAFPHCENFALMPVTDPAAGKRSGVPETSKPKRARPAAGPPRAAGVELID